MIRSYRCCLQPTTQYLPLLHPNHTYRCCLAHQTIRSRPRDFKTRQGEHANRSTHLGYINTLRSQKEAHPNTKTMKPCQPNVSMNTHGRRTKCQATNGHITLKRETAKSQLSKRLLPFPYRLRLTNTKIQESYQHSNYRPKMQNTA